MALIPISLAAAALMAVAVVLGSRPSIEPPRVWQLLLGAGGSVLATLALSLAAGVGQLPFLLGAAAASAAVLVPLLGILSASGLGVRAATAAGALWSVVVLPAALVVPLALEETQPEAGRIADFGGALGLVISAGAFALAIPAPAAEGPVDAPHVTRRVRIAAAGLLAIGFTVWLASLEGALDEYVSGVLLAALLAPPAGALGWLLVDRLTGARAPIRRSIRMGLAAGGAAVMSCAVAVPLPLAVLAGGVAGAAAAGMHESRRGRRMSVARRTGLSALTAGAVGLLASGIVGERSSFAADADLSTLGAQLAAMLAVAAWGAGVGALGLALIRRASRDRRGRRWAIPDSNR
ncbi:hypothetical protein [Homoserinibacter sp. YIM 151385]|uniref:hypothetical protein n=1 Tax=Homoserinibacter sp. YIM 151385 TaxID=2985506 RepID=UPI0022F07A3E|nr:hypothetical protein [Homoserinibacter sp. YIM 151385]WBU38701.1 hypothetical protein OF852_03725 [Homoserinibacter sp. YIM 151385]